MTSDERYLVVSTDSHIGPDPEVYRDYCDPGFRADFEGFLDTVGTGVDEELLFAARGPQDDELQRRYSSDPGVNDPHERLRNMDADGTTAEVIFHGDGSYVGRRGFIPFHEVQRSALTAVTAPAELGHMAAGKRMYNRWLADFCSVDRDRLIGVAEIPFWDPEAAAREVVWAAEVGLGAVNLPAPRPGYPTYNDPVWEAFWSATEETGLPLNCHSGIAIHDFKGTGLASGLLYWSQNQVLGHLPLPMMIFGGVFDRHPRLKTIFNEQRGYWVAQTLRELDAIYLNPWSRRYRASNPRKPSEYWPDHCFVGGSFLAHFEVEQRHQIGVETITWGRDYPHVEGTWPYSLESLRSAFFDVPEAETRLMLGENALRCYPLDGDRLRAVAARIGPLPAEVAEPLDQVPDEAYGWAFRDREDSHGGARFAAF